MRGTTLIGLVLINILWAGTYAATKVLMAEAPFFVVTSLRYGIAAVPLLWIAARQHGLAMKPRDLALCAAMGVGTFTICPAAMYAGVSLARASDAAILTATEPLLASLGAFFFLRETMKPQTAAGLILAFGGAAALSEFWNDHSTVNPLGTVLILGGVAFEALYSIIGKSLLTREPPMKITAVALGAACVVNVVILTASGQWGTVGAISPGSWLILSLYLSVVCTVVGYTFWFFALREDVVADVAVTIFIQPIAGMLIAWLWVNEVPTLTQVIGAGVVLLAVTVALFGRVRPTPPPTG